MNKKFKWLLLLSWMIIIFVFSSQPAVISDEKSKYVIMVFQLLGLNLNSMLGDLANFAVRKTAHFLEYFILYILLFNALYEKGNLRRAIILPLIVLFFYACSDELHQLFVPGRACRFKDVIIDTSGGALGALIKYISIGSKTNILKGEKHEKV